MSTESVGLQLQGIKKSFGAVQALQGVDFEVRPGEVVGLLGDNGAGKSTLVKIISGAIRPDGGEMRFNGDPLTIHSPSDAAQSGIATVYQDLALCENLNVAANLFLGQERCAPWPVLSRASMEGIARDLLKDLAVKILDPRVPVAALSGGQRQGVAIARALLGSPKVVLLDEPTAALGVEQAAEVLELVRRLRERGIGLVIVTHNMSDVRAVTDRVCVLRQGKAVANLDTARTTESDIVSAITGAAELSRQPIHRDSDEVT